MIRNGCQKQDARRAVLMVISFCFAFFLSEKRIVDCVR